MSTVTANRRSWRFARASAALFWLLVLPALGVAGRTVLADPGSQPKNVLLIFSHERERSAYDALDAAFRAELEPTRSSGVLVYTEYLDAMRFEEAEYRQHIVDFFRTKYARVPLGVIVPVSPPAVDFALDHREQFFPHVPIVFASVNAKKAEDLSRFDNLTGVGSTHDQTSTLDLALMLHPDTVRVFVPAGSSELERTWAAALRGELEPYRARVAIEFLADLPMRTLEERLRTLPANSLVFSAGLMYHDAAGQYFLPEDVLRRICQSANAPVYSTNDFELGLGIVGGHLYDMAPVGAAAGMMVRRILSGEPVSHIPVLTLHADHDAFDARQLKRWGIDARRLPPNAIVRFQPHGLWEDHRRAVIAAILVGSAQALLIVALVFEHRRRRAAEVQSRRDLATLAHLERRGAVGQLAGAIAHQLAQPLSAILRNAEAGKLMLASRSQPASTELEDVFEDIRTEDRRAAEVIQRMRALLQKRELETKVVDLNDLVRETTALAVPDAVERGIRIEHQLTVRSCMVLGDRVHLQQVLLNLLLNGFDAVADMAAERRRVIIETQSQSGRALLSVEDLGPGIPEDSLTHMFDPFFTTKPKGMGVGLSIARTIVIAHDGEIAAENNPTGGATLRLNFPLYSVSGEAMGA
jgi:signal transduction histidine kinase